HYFPTRRSSDLNINAFMGLGAGIQLKTNITEKNDFENTNDVYTIEGGQELWIPDLSSFEEGTLNDNFTNFQTGVFAEVSFGTVRIGPSAGVRYVHNFNSPSEQWHIHATWKF